MQHELLREVREDSKVLLAWNQRMMVSFSHAVALQISPPYVRPPFLTWCAAPPAAACGISNGMRPLPHPNKRHGLPAQVIAFRGTASLKNVAAGAISSVLLWWSTCTSTQHLGGYMEWLSSCQLVGGGGAGCP